MIIVKITTERFYNPKIGGYLQPKGKYCLKDERGYIGFISNPYIPYMPDGGKRALEGIEFTDESQLVFIQPMKEV